MEAVLEAENGSEKENAVERLLSASGEDPVFVYGPNGGIQTETADSVRKALVRDDDMMLPPFEAVESTEIVYEDENKYTIAVRTGEETYSIRGGYPRHLFDRNLATEDYRLRNRDGTCSSAYIVNLLSP